RESGQCECCKSHLHQGNRKSCADEHGLVDFGSCQRNGICSRRSIPLGDSSPSKGCVPNIIPYTPTRRPTAITDRADPTPTLKESGASSETMFFTPRGNEGEEFALAAKIKTRGSDLGR